MWKIIISIGAVLYIILTIFIIFFVFFIFMGAPMATIDDNRMPPIPYTDDDETRLKYKIIVEKWEKQRGIK